MSAFGGQKKTTVKICGLKTEEAVEAVAGLPVDQAGFVFAASKRQVAPEQARLLIDLLRERGSKALAVGVFVNPTLEEVARTAEQAGLDVAQLHGGESAGFCAELKRAYPDMLIYKALSVHDADGEAEPGIEEAVDRRLAPYAPYCDAFMLDTAGGGTGRTFRWDVIPAYQRWSAGRHVPLIVAGGLHPGNVRQLIEQFAPDGVDVSSGVETDGRKDTDKIAAFVERVKRVD